MGWCCLLTRKARHSQIRGDVLVLMKDWWSLTGKLWFFQLGQQIRVFLITRAETLRAQNPHSQFYPQSKNIPLACCFHLYKAKLAWLTWIQGLMWGSAVGHLGEAKLPVPACPQGIRVIPDTSNYSTFPLAPGLPPICNKPQAIWRQAGSSLLSAASGHIQRKLPSSVTWLCEQITFLELLQSEGIRDDRCNPHDLWQIQSWRMSPLIFNIIWIAALFVSLNVAGTAG